MLSLSMLTYAQLPLLISISLHEQHWQTMSYMNALLLCYRKPHGPTTKDTLARWIRAILKLSGVDTDTFTAHSCISASTSKAMLSGVALDVILKVGQWSADSTFYQFYCKDIVKSGNHVDITFAESLKTLQLFNSSVTFLSCVFSCFLTRTLLPLCVLRSWHMLYETLLSTSCQSGAL